MPDEQKQQSGWSAWRAALAAQPWLFGLFVLDLLLVGAAMGGASAQHIVPIGTLVAGTIAAFVALGQLGVARQQAAIAANRHEKQTEGDLQRRITENFSKAVEQLGSDKMQIRLGGIYTLERIARESEADYWPVMETLTAFVRESARWKNAGEAAASQTVVRFYEQEASQQAKPQPATDIAAVLVVFTRRSDKGRARERQEGWRLDLSGSDLRGANLKRAHFERAILRDAHLERANLRGTHFEGAGLRGAHLEVADLGRAHLEKADLRGARLEEAFLADAHLDEANLRNANLNGAILEGAHLDRAILTGAHLKRADLRGVRFEEADLRETHLEEAILENAHLKKADLREAHLEAAVLVGALLEGAVLEDAHLEQSVLVGTVGLIQAQLDGANGDAATRIPDRLARPLHWPTTHLPA